MPAFDPNRKDDVDYLVGCLVRLFRRALGITQVELAQSLGVSYQQVQKYETGVDRISSGRYYRICKRLDIPINLIFWIIENPERFERHVVEKIGGAPIRL